MSNTPSDLIRVHCPCGARMKVRSSSLGRKAKCPTCEEVFVIAKDAPAKDQPIDMAPAEAAQSQDSLLEELARQERQQVAVSTDESPSNPSNACPKCGTRMPGHAVMCVSCGFNTQTGRIVKGTSTKEVALEATMAERIRLMVAGAGSYILGCVFSGIGALIGAGLWYVIAVYANFEIGWIAWILGVLAGAGMILGYKGQNLRAGVTAVGMALFGIFAAKLAIFAFFVIAASSGEAESIDDQRYRLTNTLTERKLDEQQIWSNEERESRWKETYVVAKREVDGLSDDRVVQTSDELKSQQEQARMGDDGLEMKRDRVVSHRTDLNSIQKGLSYSDNRRDRIYDEEFEKCSRLNEAQLDDQIAQIEHWEKEGKWSDDEYVHDQLAYKFLDQEFEKDPANKDKSVMELSRSQWSRLYKKMGKKVDAIVLDDRVQQLQAYEKKVNDKYMRNRLAYHEMDLKAKSEGLAYRDKKREQIHKDFEAEFALISSEELVTRTQALEQWEKSGKESDYSYLRNQLIYLYVNELMEERRNQSRTDSEAYWEPNSQEWEELYSQAKEKVDPLSDNELAAGIELVKQQRASRWQRLIDESEREAIEEFAGEVASVFFSAMFSPMDALFILLAVGSAFKIAIGGSDN